MNPGPRVACLLDPLDTVTRHALLRYALVHHWVVRDFSDPCHEAESLSDWQPDGVVAHERLLQASGFLRASRKRVPVVLLGPAGDPASLPRVLPDLFHACRTLVRHFAEQPLKNVWMVTSSAAEADAATRAQAWALAGRAERVRADVLYYDDPESLRRHGVPVSVRRARQGLAALAGPLIRRWLCAGEGLALYAPAFFDAVELLRACLAEGIAVPGRVALATDTDHPEDGLYTPVTMTCLAYDGIRLANGAFDLLQRMMKGERVAGGPHAFVVDHLVVRRSTEAAEPEHPALTPYLHFIREHCADPRLTPVHVAGQFRMSLRTLQYQFRRNLKMGVAECIMSYRVNRARASLQNAVRRTPLVQVAEVAGFSDVRQMRRAFRRATGREPKMFRRE